MVKKFLFFACFVFFAQADLIDEKVKSLVEKDAYTVQEKLINIIFKNKDMFYTQNGEVDVVKIAKELKNNGLLNLSFQTPTSFNVTFDTNQNPIFFIKLITNALNSMGYYTFTIKSAKKEGTIFSFTTTLTNENAIDPTVFAEALAKNNSKILNIVKNSNTNWNYLIDISNAIITEAKELELGKQIELEKSISEYWLKVSNTKLLKIASKPTNSWYPYIAFYDKNLNLLGDYKKGDEVVKNMNIKIPENCLYIKISDIYTLNNIKAGFSVHLKGDSDVSRD